MAVRLQGLGFDARPEELFTPIPLTLRYLKENNLRPFLIVDPGKTINKKLLMYIFEYKYILVT